MFDFVKKENLLHTTTLKKILIFKMKKLIEKYNLIKIWNYRI
ncbi:hypothetical protein J536_2332 [Acinetobacter sp. 809848]|nr:hypothetical protein J536_2332 [Acinetobacter sp. 809848]